jgi:hypothetical protein
MRSVAIAEWVLARYAGEQRAWTAMGDLLEEREQKGASWFWRSYSGMLIAVAWRPVLAFVAALFACGSAWNWLMHRQIGMIVTPELEVATLLGVVGSFVVMYSGVRYGLRDMLTQLAGIVTASATTAIILCRHELSLLAWTGTTVIFVIACAVMPKTRRTAIVFVATGASLFLAFLLMAFVGSMYTRYALHLRLLGDKELRDHPSIGYVNLVVQLVGQAVTAWICKEMHRILIERRRILA